MIQLFINDLINAAGASSQPGHCRGGGGKDGRKKGRGEHSKLRTVCAWAGHAGGPSLLDSSDRTPSPFSFLGEEKASSIFGHSDIRASDVALKRSGCNTK